ncbi:DegT/DnrJ/EryC1/StrS family aminotransferase, partial [Candidatus Babeliales bacterium]|nr:DegT/DnrJ/EryC1/StrS family aminotransferase [Candidatus Babeliales bacterium]
KIITTSGGGALVSSNEQYVNHSRFLATQARDNAPHYEHSHIGYNYRMSNIIAGIGRGQMEVLEERVKQRRDVHMKYMEYLSPAKDSVYFQEEWSEDCFSNFWLTTIIFSEGFIIREKVRLALENENIEARPLWKPLHLQPVFSDCLFYLNGTSEKLFSSGLCIPSGSNLEDSEILEISQVIMDQL